jgi:hypothetical protein
MLGANILWYGVHGPFTARELRGKKSTPSVGWEVPTTSCWLASKEPGMPLVEDQVKILIMSTGSASKLLARFGSILPVAYD